MLCAAITGCTTNPYAMRDYGAVIEQARKVGVGSASAPADGKRASDAVSAPCLVDGREVGYYTRTLQADGTVAYTFSEGCSAAEPRRDRP